MKKFPGSLSGRLPLDLVSLGWRVTRDWQRGDDRTAKY
jgi:hypothetical protein